MKNYLILFIFLLSTAFSYAQFNNPTGTSTRERGIGKITGTVFDEEGGSGVEFSTISLYLDDELVDGTITDDKGSFSIIELIDGTYKLEISFLGYETVTLDDIVIEKERTVDLGEIYLAKNAAVLEEVTVTGQRALIEEKVDRMV